jgi:hypothetical protein
MGIESAALIFFPQHVLMFVFPPSYPIHDDGSVSYLDVWGKILVAFPASIVYALLLVGAFWLLKKLFAVRHEGGLKG